MKRISNYAELVAERVRLELVIADRKQAIHDKFENLEKKVAPVLSILSFFKPDNSGKSTLWKAGSSIAIDLMGARLLKYAGWLTRLVVPSLLKLVSAKVIERVRK